MKPAEGEAVDSTLLRTYPTIEGNLWTGINLRQTMIEKAKQSKAI
jgi:hypothetical protein